MPMMHTDGAADAFLMVAARSLLGRVLAEGM